MEKIKLNKTTELRPLQQSDVSDIFHAIDTQREYMRKWLPFVERTHSIEDTLKIVRAAVNDADRGDYTFVIVCEGRFAGLIGFKDTDRDNCKTEIGYRLCAEYQGQGLMTLAVKALCDLAFGKLKINRIQIKCAVGNTRSKRIPLRLGFRYEGNERDGERMADGRFTDLDIYSKLRTEK